jgi:hypothetical protein
VTSTWMAFSVWVIFAFKEASVIDWSAMAVFESVLNMGGRSEAPWW